tara:strand:+ start:180 stop:674 length:495 start_codon:yes stop_codon:yes gene_type:complete
MNFLKISIGIFLVLAASRFVPHPPNFTSLIALSFYVPAVLGRKFIPAILLSFFITDLIIGFHQTLFFTWGSIVVIGLISKYFVKNIKWRAIGVLLSAIIFFILSNFGVWLTGSYGYTMNGLISCYIMAIPFFKSTLAATIIYSFVIEIIYKLIIKEKIFTNNLG